MKITKYIEEKLDKEPLFRKVFVHTSNKDKLPHHKTNEALEAVGDKALDVVLYKHLFQSSKGTIIKSEMDGLRQDKCSKDGLAPIFDQYDLHKYAVFSDSNPPINNEVKHNIVESLSGAIFLIEGFKKAEKLLKKFILYP